LRRLRPEARRILFLQSSVIYISGVSPCQAFLIEISSSLNSSLPIIGDGDWLKIKTVHAMSEMRLAFGEHDNSKHGEIGS